LKIPCLNTLWYSASRHGLCFNACVSYIRWLKFVCGVNMPWQPYARHCRWILPQRSTCYQDSYCAPPLLPLTNNTLLVYSFPYRWQKKAVVRIACTAEWSGRVCWKIFNGHSQSGFRTSGRFLKARIHIPYIRLDYLLEVIIACAKDDSQLCMRKSDNRRTLSSVPVAVSRVICNRVKDLFRRVTVVVWDRIVLCIRATVTTWRCQTFGAKYSSIEIFTLLFLCHRIEILEYGVIM
jgi:hypothetical protein